MQSITTMDLEALRERLDDTDDPEERMMVLNQLSNKLLHHDTGQALAHANELLRLATASGDRRWIARGLIRIGRYHTARSEFERALRYLDRARRMLESLPVSPLELALLYCFIAMAHGMRSDYPRAMEWSYRAMEMCRGREESHEMVSSMISMGMIHGNLGDLPRALEFMGEALRLCEAHGHREALKQVLGNLASIYMMLNEPETALRHYSRSLEIAREMEERMSEGGLLNGIGALYMTLGKLEMALDHHMKALEIFEGLGMKYHMAAALFQLAATYKEMGAPGIALEYLERSLALYPETGNRHGEGVALMTMAEIHLAAGDAGAACMWMSRALAVIEPLNERAALGRAYATLSAIHEQRGEHRQALECHKRSVEEKDRMEREGAQRALAMMETRAEVEKAVKEREIYRTKSDELAREVERKDQALTAAALRITRSNGQAAKLEERVLAYAGGSGSDADELVKGLLADIRASRSDEGRWRMFEEQFIHLHPRFLHAMSSLCPALTPGELKVCALLRLSLSTKDIADVLCTSLRTIDNHRRHIRVKLGLPRATNLITFLASVQ